MKKTLLTLVFALLVTMGSNAQWVAQSSGFTLPLFDMTFLTPDKGYVVGQFLTILETHNGGTDWNTQMSTSTSWFIGCDFTDTSTGYAVANGGQMYKTTDGGTNWNILSTGTSSPLYGVHFLNDDTGFVCGLFTMLKTTNAGASWAPYTVSASLRRLFFTSVSDGYCVGQSGTILKTANCGGSWVSQTSGVTVNLSDVYFTDVDTGWIVGDAGTILKTSNGGTTWSALTSGVTAGLIGVWFITPSVGYVVGTGGTILKTTDGGTTWNPQSSGTTADLLKVSFPSSTVGYISGASGTILKTLCGTTPAASFTDTGTTTFGFVYTGTGSVDSVGWTFGDGGTSAITNPTHTYTASGTYTVCVVAYSACGNDTSCSSVVAVVPPPSVGVTATALSNTDWRVYPSPSNSVLNLAAPDKITSVVIRNTIGQTVFRNQYNELHVKVDVTNFPGGLYFIEMNSTQVRKFVKE